MKSKLAIAVILCGWFLFIAWLAFDYIEYGNRMLIHIFQQPFRFQESIFYILIILVPFVYTVLGYLVNERLTLLARFEENEKYRTHAFVDKLTSLLNLKGFSLLAEQQLKVADRSNKGLLLIYIDVDRLKQLNDTFGHSAGDMALIDVANIMKMTFRKSDILARIGGDEFVILALDSSWAFSEILALRLQKNLQDHHTEATRPYKLSLSMGFSHYSPENPCSLEELIEKAGKYMHEGQEGKQMKDILGID
jgi:diguanylate cyclase (GGDEF)-like protein